MKTTEVDAPAGRRTIKTPSKRNPLVVKISQRKWYRGKGSCRSRLLKPISKQMCCLGFDALALGFEKDDISGEWQPGDLNCEVPGLHSGLVQTQICRDMMIVNDSTSITDHERKKQLRKLAKKIHRKFIFTK